ncbi:hemin uptake protein HemP [Rubellimicrobium roseum]|uniref:Hemin uptake protein HemP n=1 Tax=Rubellimicrobium roseum TaxID=687525 RepID=A0A5C4NPM6_9RHOB|nr:hemin uptake protein HemP [Rubellimicrobium roseum]TNC75026.1 hemin uptake protein HemP [Rubellimicrobium roseum]
MTAPRPTAAPIHDARDLVGPSGLGRITLDDQVYTLRITRAGKLILTK